MMSPGSNSWFLNDCSHLIIQLLSQEHFHGLRPSSNRAEMFTLPACFGTDCSMFSRKFATLKRATNFKSSAVIFARLQ